MAKAFRVLGVDVAAVQIADVIRQIEEWLAGAGRGRHIAVTGMHGIMEAQSSESFRAILRSADMVVPDGMPLVWLGRLRGHGGLRRRVYGPELMLELCRVSAGRGYRHFFYGGAPGVAERLAQELKRRFAGLEVAGIYSPPFRPLTEAEDQEVIERINHAKTDVLWVGLGTPKQERWIAEHQGRLTAGVMLGVGAAFDIHSGRCRQAPAWMREHGLEWLYRLLQEPRRLWRRYLVLGPQFVCLVSLEILGFRRGD